MTEASTPSSPSLVARRPVTLARGHGVGRFRSPRPASAHLLVPNQRLRGNDAHARYSVVAASVSKQNGQRSVREREDVSLAGWMVVAGIGCRVASRTGRLNRGHGGTSCRLQAGIIPESRYNQPAVVRMGAAFPSYYPYLNICYTCPP